MKFASFLATTVLVAAAAGGPAHAICLGTTSADGCPQPFVNIPSGQVPDSSLTTQGFDSRTDTQWSQTTTPFGTFRFSVGAGQYDPWNNPSRFGNGLSNPGPGMDTPGQPNACAFYGNCQ